MKRGEYRIKISAMNIDGSTGTLYCFTKIDSYSHFRTVLIFLYCDNVLLIELP